MNKTQEQIIAEFVSNVHPNISNQVAIEIARDIRIGAMEILLIKKGFMSKTEYNETLIEMLTNVAENLNKDPLSDL